MFIAVLFLFSEICAFPSQALANTPSSLPVQEGNKPVQLLSQPLNEADWLPSEFGLIDEIYRGEQETGTIVFIQDAHDSLEAQENIAKIITHLVETKDVGTVFEEGYEGPVPTGEYFGFIKEPVLKQKVSHFFLDHLRIGGAEYAHINRAKDFELIGADSIRLHKENVDQYRFSAEKKGAIKEDLEALEKEIRVLVDKRFPKEFREWLKLKNRFDSKQIDLLNYLSRTMPLITSTPHEDAAIPLLQFLMEAVKTNDLVAMEKVKRIDAREVFGEMIKLEQAVADAWLEGAIEQELFGHYKILQLLKRLNDLEVTQEEYEAVKVSLQVFDTQSLGEFIHRHASKPLVLSKQWEQNVRDAMKFYEIAKTRDAAVANTLEKYFPVSATAVLVYGGFHKENIKRILEAQGISYVVVSPRITQPSARHEAFYRKLMTQGMHSFERTIAPVLAHASRVLPIFTVPNGRAEVQAVHHALLANPKTNLLTLDRYIDIENRSEIRVSGVSYSLDEILKIATMQKYARYTVFRNDIIEIGRDVEDRLLDSLGYQGKVSEKIRLVRKEGAENDPFPHKPMAWQLSQIWKMAMANAADSFLQRQEIFNDGKVLAVEFYFLVDKEAGEIVLRTVNNGMPPALAETSTRKKVLMDRGAPRFGGEGKAFKEALPAMLAAIHPDAHWHLYDRKGPGMEAYGDRDGAVFEIRFPLEGLMENWEVMDASDSARSEMRPLLNLTVKYTRDFYDAVNSLYPGDRDDFMRRLHEWLSGVQHTDQNSTVGTPLSALSSGYSELKRGRLRLIFKYEIQSAFSPNNPKHRQITLYLYWPKKKSSLNQKHLDDALASAATYILRPDQPDDAQKIREMSAWLYEEDHEGLIEPDDLRLVLEHFGDYCYGPVQYAGSLTELVARDEKGTTFFDRNIKARLGPLGSPLLFFAIDQMQRVLQETESNLDHATARWLGNGGRYSEAMYQKAKQLLEQWIGTRDRLLFLVSGFELKQREPDFSSIASLYFELSGAFLRQGVQTAIREWVRNQPETQEGLARIKKGYAELQAQNKLDAVFADDVIEGQIRDRQERLRNAPPPKQKPKKIVTPPTVETRSLSTPKVQPVRPKPVVRPPKKEFKLPDSPQLKKAIEQVKGVLLGYAVGENLITDAAARAVLTIVFDPEGSNTSRTKKLSTLLKISGKKISQLRQQIEEIGMLLGLGDMAPDVYAKKLRKTIQQARSMVSGGNFEGANQRLSFLDPESDTRKLLEELISRQGVQTGELEKLLQEAEDLKADSDSIRQWLLALERISSNPNMVNLASLMAQWESLGSEQKEVVRSLRSTEENKRRLIDSQYDSILLAADILPFFAEEDSDGNPHLLKLPGVGLNRGGLSEIFLEEALMRISEIRMGPLGGLGMSSPRSEMRFETVEPPKFEAVQPEIMRFDRAKTMVVLSVSGANETDPEARWFDDHGVSRLYRDRVHPSITVGQEKMPYISGDPRIEKFKMTVSQFIEEYEAVHPDETVVTALPNGNLGINDWFAGIRNGKVYTSARNPVPGRVYDMLAMKDGGELAVMSLQFMKEDGTRGVFNEAGDSVSGIKHAIFGQRIVKDGRDNLANLHEQFDDLRHIFRLPFFRFQRDGVEQNIELGFSDDRGELYTNHELIRQALLGNPITLSLKPLLDKGLSLYQIRKKYLEWGYNEVLAAILQPGDFRISAAEKSIEIILLPAVYPHSFIGIDKDGNVLIGNTPEGDSKFKGLNLPATIEKLIAMGAQDVFLWANGKDLAGTKHSRGGGLEAILLTQKRSETRFSSFRTERSLKEAPVRAEVRTRELPRLPIDDVTEAMLLYPKELMHSPELYERLDAFDKEHYEFVMEKDGEPGYWQSKDFPKLVLGTWEDIEKGSVDSDVDMPRHIVIRYKRVKDSTVSFYFFDNHGSSVPYAMEAAARREMPLSGNVQLFVDEHDDGSPKGDDDQVNLVGGPPQYPPVGDKLRLSEWQQWGIGIDNFNSSLIGSGLVGQHLWIDGESKIRQAFHGSQGFLTIQRHNPNGKTWREQHGRSQIPLYYRTLGNYFERKERPRNQSAFINIDTDATGVERDDIFYKNAGRGPELKDFEFHRDFLVKLAKEDKVTPSTFHASTSTHFDPTDGEKGLTNEYGHVELVRFLARVAPAILLSSEEGLPTPKLKAMVDQAIEQHLDAVSSGAQSQGERIVDTVRVETWAKANPTGRSEMRTDEIFDEVKPEFAAQVAELFEQGLELDESEEAIGVHGTSIEAIAELLKTGHMPDSARTPGEFYFYPLHQSDFDAADEAKTYAEANALVQYVTRKLGFELNNDELEELFRFLLIRRNRKDYASLLAKCREHNITEKMLESWIVAAEKERRKGVLVIVSRVAGSQVYDGADTAANEKFIQLKGGLPIASILGIEPVGQFEWNALASLQEKFPFDSARSEVRSQEEIQQGIDASQALKNGARMRARQFLKYNRELIQRFLEWDQLRTIDSDEGREGAELALERIREYTETFKKVAEKIRPDEGHAVVGEQELYEKLGQYSVEPPAGITQQQVTTGLVAESRLLKEAIDQLPVQFLEAHRAQDKEQLRTLNEQAVALYKARLKAQLLQAYSYLREEKINRTALGMVLTAIRLGYLKVSHQYGWTIRRALEEAAMQKIKVVGGSGAVKTVYDYENFKMATEENKKGKTNPVTIYQDSWVRQDLEDGAIIYKPERIAHQFEDIPSAIRSRFHTLSSQEQDYAQIYDRINDLDYIADLLRAYGEELPGYYMEEIQESVNFIMHARRGGLDNKRARVDQKGNAAANIKTAVTQLEAGNTERAIEMFDAARTELEGRLVDIERKKSGVDSQAEYLIHRFRKMETVKTIHELQGLIEEDQFQEGRELLRILYRTHYLPIASEENQYASLQRSVSRLGSSLRRLSNQDPIPDQQKEEMLESIREDIRRIDLMTGAARSELRAVNFDPIFNVNEPVVFVIEQARIDALSPEMFRELLGLAAVNEEKLHIVIPDAINGQDSQRVEDLRLLAQIHLNRLPEIAKRANVQVIGFSDTEENVETFKARLGEKIAGQTSAYFGTDQAGNFAVALLYALQNIERSELRQKNGYLFGTDRLIGQALETLWNAFTVISSAA